METLPAPDEILIGTLNVRALRGKIDDIIALVEHHSLDILCITETHLHKNVDNSEISIDNFTLVRRDRNCHGGGVAIYAHQSLSAQPLPLTEREPSPDSQIESVWVEIKRQGEPLLIGCIYRPPSASVGAWLQFEDQVENRLRFRPKSDVILTGDFNVDFLDPTHPHLPHLKHFLATFNLLNHTTAPTRISTQRNSCLDLFITSEDLPVQSSNPFPAENINTDHELILSSLPKTSSKPHKKDICKSSRALSKINSNSFSQDLQQSGLHSADTTGDVDKLWKDWHAKVTNVLDKHAPLRQRHNRRRRHRLCPWSTPALRHLVHLRHVAHDRLLKSPTDTAAREVFRDLRKQCTDLSRTLKNAYFKEKCRTYSRDPRSLWNTINALTGRMKTHTPPQASVKDLSDFFASVVTDPNRPIQLTEPGTTTAPHRLLDCFQKVDESTVLELLQSIDDRKSAGSDGLPGCILKNYAKDLTPSVTQLINASLTSSELPTPLKLATVSPIFKNGDPSLATQYRPISLLPLVSKLLEKVVARQLRSYLEEFSIIPKEQFAYRQHHSTEDALVYAINNFLMAKDQGLYTGLVFVDMSKAFDRVEHQTLINDLSNIGVRGSALKWFINYLTDRQQQVRCGNTVSAPTSCSRGVPQGSVLGPLLFLLYTRKVPEVLSATKTIKSVLFADDILIYCSGKTPTTLAACLSEAATRLGTWLTERGLCINVNKTKAMLLPPKHQQCPADISIRCCDATLSIVNEYKYLGVIIDSTLSWEAHVDRVVSKVAKKIGALRRAGNSLTQAARRQYYLSVIQSDLQYGTNAYWTTLTNARQNRLIRSSKRALRAVINAPTTTPTKTILSLLNLSPLETRLKLKLLVHTFRCIHNKASSLLCAQYQVRSPTHSTQRTTRAQTYTSLIIPRVSKSAGAKSPAFFSTLLWNELPSDLRSLSSVHSFRQKLMVYLDSL